MSFHDRPFAASPSTFRSITRALYCALWASACGDPSSLDEPVALHDAPPTASLAADSPPDAVRALRGDASEQDAAARYPVGTQLIHVTTSEGRELPVQLWYPAVEAARAEAERGRPLVDIEPPGAHRDVLAGLLETAPSPSTNKRMHAADAPEVADAPAALPLLIFSHCNDCIRFSSFTVAEHLAKLGFVVASADHLRNTLYDNLEGTSVGLDAAFLAVRVADVTSVLDTLLDEGATVVPEGLRGRIDADRIGVFGHSFGGMTAGAMERDPRVRAVAALTIPVGMGGLGRVLEPRYADVAKMRKPLLLLKADEDIGLLNVFIDDNFATYPGLAWRVTIGDTAHYSVTDLCALNDFFDMGCGRGFRQSLPVPLTYLDIDVARDLTALHVGAFFQQELLGIGKGPAGVPKHPKVAVELHTGK